MNGQFGNKYTWSRLRHLIDPNETKSASRKNVQRIIDSFPGDDNTLIKELKNRYFNVDRDFSVSNTYTGQENEALDKDIKEAEVQAVLNSIKTTAAAGKAGVTNKMLRNLDDHSIIEITKFFNIHRIGSVDL
ncbi:hypothetical protein HPB49_007158 [Dermacentor silvarum]|uniref:Uncharacterized protein n=1 Tax=Dermacentor silvarum TaxID=543639 RepID=A0ACB8C7Z4_DERSI|nr:hypothetical protein HPB49_007158 [Dermacentor silvarum]